MKRLLQQETATSHSPTADSTKWNIHYSVNYSHQKHTQSISRKHLCWARCVSVLLNLILCCCFHAAAKSSQTIKGTETRLGASSAKLQPFAKGWHSEDVFFSHIFWDVGQALSAEELKDEPSGTMWDFEVTSCRVLLVHRRNNVSTTLESSLPSFGCVWIRAVFFFFFLLKDNW